MQERDRIQEILEKIPGFTFRQYHDSVRAGATFHNFHFYVDCEETLKKMLKIAARHEFETLVWLDDDKVVYAFGIQMFGKAASFIEEYEQVQM